MIGRARDYFWRLATFPYREVMQDPGISFERARVLVSVSYAAWVVYSLALFRIVPNWSKPPSELLWPAAWLRFVPWQPTLYAIFISGVFVCLLAALAPGSRLLRLLAFALVFEGQAVRYSYGKIDHSSHTWVLALFLLIFLPRLSRKTQATEKQSYLEIIWGVQAVTLACYSVAGVQKLWGAWIDWGHGITVFHPNALAYQIAALTNSGTIHGPLGGALIERPWLGQPFMLVAVFLEFTALAVAWRPRLHGVWAALLISMHIGIMLTMNIWFDPMILMVGVWLLFSPFATRPFCLRAALRDIPWFGPGLAALHARLRKPVAGERIVVFYDGDCGMCDFIVAQLLRIGVPDHVYFASQQGETWARLLADRPLLANMDTIVVLREHGDEREVRVRSEAVLWLLAQLRLPWALLSAFMLVPMPMLNVGYRIVAANRKRISTLLGGERCAVLSPEQRMRLIA